MRIQVLDPRASSSSPTTSTAVDTAVGGDVYRDVSIYRPRFISVTFDGPPAGEPVRPPAGDDLLAILLGKRAQSPRDDRLRRVGDLGHDAPCEHVRNPAPTMRMTPKIRHDVCIGEMKAAMPC